MHPELETIIRDILYMTRDYETLPDWALGLKLGEETGEVCEELMKANGFSQHKEPGEGVIYEVADVINVCLGLLTQHYAEENIEDIVARLETALFEKSEKYRRVLQEGANG